MFEAIIFIGVVNAITTSLAAVGVYRLNRQLAAVGQRVIDAVEQTGLEVKSTVVNESDRLGEEFALTRHQNFWLHKLTRTYCGFELLERRVLPALGYKEPTRRADYEEKLTDAFRKQHVPRTLPTSDAPVPAIDCGRF